MSNEMENFLEEIDKSMRAPRKGEVVTGTVLHVTNDDIAVNIGYKSDGIIPRNELSYDGSVNPNEIVKPGDEIKVYVIKNDDGDGNVLLSKKRVDIQKGWDDLEKIKESESLVEAKATEAVRGGVVAIARNIRCFIPASQLSDRYVDNLNEYIGKTFTVKVIEIIRDKNRAILSRKAVIEEENRARKQEIYNSLEKGQVIKGTVRQITNFGAFIDIGGVDGLVHISEISWGRLKHPSDILTVGDEVTVEVIDFDRDKQKISLSIKNTTTAPWSNVEESYNVGSIVEGKVVRLADFGAFIELKPGLDGLLHISQISKEHIAKPSDKLEVGETVQVKVIEIDPEKQRMSLSITAIEEDKDNNFDEYTTNDDPVTIGDILKNE
ncbi:30S ribosomal protein S1 [Serpentinicella sp. ANB-PHB4]|uniref:30S ribosomal protein S1 n=1 Tax=Serpentinicella sp. ANB-PHB4 TaxID=3074076 RepID=UPI0028552EE9|nr:30S ribosomal protein S1 [Serpentinicella sp. ANB-PHB4]MDR5658365.1 30S ribosomal protein S1 [Serpentinicella sp. ANB-PHB4]